MRYVPFLVGLLLFLPAEAGAALVINEIAWMGSSDSPNDEWIELYNDGSAIDVNGWTLTDNASLSISLLGTVPAGAHVVLERTDDDSSSAPAFLIYSGALSNDGRTLTLLRADGSIADQVAGGEGWAAVGGDNETKDTAQLTKSGWITAVPTPGEENSMIATKVEEEVASEDTDAMGTLSKGTKKESVRISLTQPNTELTLTVPERITTHVGRAVHFEVVASGIGETLIDSLSYTWNFGDGTVKTGKTQAHQYEYAGTYVAIVEASYAHHGAYAQTEVVVLPLHLSLDADDEVVRIHNKAQYTTDISRMVLSNGHDTFHLPLNTMLAARGTLTLPKKKLGFAHTMTLALTDLRGKAVARYPSEVENRDAVASEPTDLVNPFHSASGMRSAPTSTVPEPAVLEAATSSEAVVEQSSTTALESKEIDPALPFPAPAQDRFPLTTLALFGVIVLSIGSLYSVRLS